MEKDYENIDYLTIGGEKMAKYRIARLNQEIVREMSVILTEIKDPRIASQMVSITAADCSADLKNANVYFSVLSGKGSDVEIDKEKAKEIEKILKNAEGYARSRLAKRLNLRNTPELNFRYDSSIIHGSELSKLFNKIETDIKENDDNDGK